MMKFPLKLLRIAVCGLAAGPVVGPVCMAQNSHSVYDPSVLFAPGFYTDKSQLFHSANGAPAANYWQNRADYEIHASLDTISNELTASEVVTYTNNSPDTLRALWLQLDQNTYREEARSNYYTDPAPTEFTKGFVLVSVKVGQEEAYYAVNDTRMQIRLKHPLAASGGKVSISINYHYTVPGAFGSRTDYVATRNGKIYEIAQWYPRMCVYDDREGWNTLPFLGSGEFYCEYGNFDYYVTVPAGMIVAGSGELQNPGEVLTKKEQARLAEAKNSDKTVMIREAGDIGSETRVGTGSARTWHFRMNDTRDVAFGASRAYLWDAASANVGKWRGRAEKSGGAGTSRRSLAMSIYPVESAGDSAWGRATEYLKGSMEEFSRWFEYPYPVAINEAGIAGGMEYPGIVFDGMTDKGKVLYWVTAHEIGHNWFPMIVGSDERRYAWMDEGFNTFIDVLASNRFNHGEFAPKRDDEYAPGGGDPNDEIIPWLKDPSAPVMMTRADAVPEKYRHAMEYFKPAQGLVLLREAILGEDRFDYAYSRYISNWAFRHPSPVDFFRTMDNEAGEDLSWFWREWFYNNWTLDLAIQDVAYPDNDPRKGVRVTIANLARMAMPSTVEVVWKDGHRVRIALPVETWLQSGEHVLTLPGGQALASVTIDPDHLLPDENRGNNVWKAGGSFKQ